MKFYALEARRSRRRMLLVRRPLSWRSCNRTLAVWPFSDLRIKIPKSFVWIVIVGRRENYVQRKTLPFPAQELRQIAHVNAIEDLMRSHQQLIFATRRRRRRSVPQTMIRNSPAIEWPIVNSWAVTCFISRVPFFCFALRRCFGAVHFKSALIWLLNPNGAILVRLDFGAMDDKHILFSHSNASGWQILFNNNRPTSFVPFGGASESDAELETRATSRI